MIKLSLFMLDPVAAHAKYMKEMQKTIDKQAKKNATLKHEMKRVLNSIKEK